MNRSVKFAVNNFFFLPFQNVDSRKASSLNRPASSFDTLKVDRTIFPFDSQLFNERESTGFGLELRNKTKVLWLLKTEQVQVSNNLICIRNRNTRIITSANDTLLYEATLLDWMIQFPTKFPTLKFCIYLTFFAVGYCGAVTQCVLGFCYFGISIHFIFNTTHT